MILSTFPSESPLMATRSLFVKEFVISEASDVDFEYRSEREKNLFRSHHNSSNGVNSCRFQFVDIRFKMMATWVIVICQSKNKEYYWKQQTHVDANSLKSFKFDNRVVSIFHNCIIIFS